MKLFNTRGWRLGHGVAALLALLVAILVALALQSAAWADPEAEGSGDAQATEQTNDAAASGDIAYGEANKNEVVYVKGDATGATTGLYVVNEFNTDAQMRVLDPGKYTQINNLSTAQPLEQAKGNVSVVTLAGEPTYYQGTMETTTTLPWAISVRYSLNGHDVAPGDLAGQSGALDVMLDVTPLSDADVADFADSYVLQAQGTFDDATFTLEEAEDATVAHVGGSTTVAYMVLPGEGGTYHITGKAKDFEYGGWQITGMPLSMAIDLRDQDTSGLTDAAGELEDATSQLADGTRELRDGLKDLSSGTKSAASGAANLKSGANELTDGTEALASGSAAAAEGAAAIAKATDGVQSGASQLASGLEQLKAGVDKAVEQSAAGASQVEAAKAAYGQTLKNLLATDPTDVQARETAIQALNDAVEGLAKASGAEGAYKALTSTEQGKSLQDGIGEAASGASELAAGAGDLAGGANELASSMEGLADGANQVHSGAQALAQGSGTLASGLDTLASGSFSAYEGARQLTSGNQALAEAVSGIDDKILDELQKAIDEKLGSDFEPHSFVVPSNTKVDSVQFVYVFDGIEIPEPEEEPVEEEPEKSIIDRFFDLFK